MCDALPRVLLELAAYRVSILHLSDLHEQAIGPDTPPARRDQIRLHAGDRHRILGDSFIKYLRELADKQQLHIACFTGDVADWGLPGEYTAAATRLSNILEAAGIPGQRTFIVPGNHDVARMTARDAWKGVRRACEDPHLWPEVSSWIASEHAAPPRSCKAQWRDAILRRGEAFWAWARTAMARPDLVTGRDGLGRLGYAARAEVDGIPFPIHVVGLDSSWLSGADNEQNRLILTHAQYSYLPCDKEGKKLDGFCFGIVHHPLEHLADNHHCGCGLAGHLQMLLHGHSHWRSEAEIHEAAAHLPILGTGTLYENTQGEDWWHSFSSVECYLDSLGKLLAYQLEVHTWDPVNQGWRGWKRPASITTSGFRSMEEALARGECGLDSYSMLAANFIAVARTMSAERTPSGR